MELISGAHAILYRADAGGGLLVDDADLSPAWIAANLVPRLTDPAVLERMSRAAEHAGARDGDVVLAQRVLAVVNEQRVLGDR